MFMPGVWSLWSKKNINIFQKEKGNTFTLLIIFIVKSLQKEQISQIYYYDPRSAKINVQSTQIESTPRRLNFKENNSKWFSKRRQKIIVSVHSFLWSRVSDLRHEMEYICTLWQYGLWTFQTGGTKLERFLYKNQHTWRKLLNFENWVNEGLRCFQKSEF